MSVTHSAKPRKRPLALARQPAQVVTGTAITHKRDINPRKRPLMKPTSICPWAHTRPCRWGSWESRADTARAPLHIGGMESTRRQDGEVKGLQRQVERVPEPGSGTWISPTAEGTRASSGEGAVPVQRQVERVSEPSSDAWISPTDAQPKPSSPGSARRQAVAGSTRRQVVAGSARPSLRP